jgi:hypothetical protein
MTQKILSKLDLPENGIIVLGILAMALLASILAVSAHSGMTVVSSERQSEGVPRADVMLSRARAAESARLTGLANYYLSVDQSPRQMPSMTRAQVAEAARLTGLAGYYLGVDDTPRSAPSMTRVQLAEIARLTGLAGHYLDLKSLSRTRAHVADTARLTGLANYYLGQAPEIHQSPSLNRAQTAEAARLTAMALAFGVEPNQISPGIAHFVGR